MKSAELEETLLVLPLDAVTQLVEVLARYSIVSTVLKDHIHMCKSGCCELAMKLKLLLVVFSFFLRSTTDPLPPLVSWSRFFRNWIKISEPRFNIPNKLLLELFPTYKERSVTISLFQVGGLCDMVGTNLAGLRHLQDRLEEQRGGEGK